MSIRFHIIGFTLGALLVVMGLTQLIPALVDTLGMHVNGNVFFFSAMTCLFFGIGMVLTFRTDSMKMSLRETFMLTSLSWLFLCIFGAIPLYISDLDLSYVDAFFESTSGVTTTGSTVLSGLDSVSPGVLIWRSILQWIGGVGIIAFAIVLLPFLRVGGMQLFQAESSDQSDKIMPRSSAVVFSILVLYLFLTIACAFLYYLFGMTSFDAVNHAMTTISTGGYSTHDASFGHFKSDALSLICIIFMILGSLPFVLYIRAAFQGQVWSIFKDEQVIVFLGIIAALVIGLGGWLWMNSAFSLSESLLAVAFSIVSIITTTGYATEDYTLWGAFATMMIFFVIYIGGCAGSTSGGVKVIRIIVAVKACARQIKNLIYPRGVFTMRYQGRSLRPSLVLSVFGYLGIYVGLNMVLTIALSLTGLDFTTALSAAATAVANVGPGMGEIIGPSGTFAPLSDTAKYLLCIGMLLGRLEVLTVMVLFTTQYWSD